MPVLTAPAIDCLSMSPMLVNASPYRSSSRLSFFNVIPAPTVTRPVEGRRDAVDQRVNRDVKVGRDGDGRERVSGPHDLDAAPFGIGSCDDRCKFVFAAWSEDLAGWKR